MTNEDRKYIYERLDNNYLRGPYVPKVKSVNIPHYPQSNNQPRSFFGNQSGQNFGGRRRNWKKQNNFHQRLEQKAPDNIPSLFSTLPNVNKQPKPLFDPQTVEKLRANLKAVSSRLNNRSKNVENRRNTSNQNYDEREQECNFVEESNSSDRFESEENEVHERNNEDSMDSEQQQIFEQDYENSSESKYRQQLDNDDYYSHEFQQEVEDPQKFVDPIKFKQKNTFELNVVDYEQEEVYERDVEGPVDHEQEKGYEKDVKGPVDHEQEEVYERDVEDTAEPQQEEAFKQDSEDTVESEQEESENENRNQMVSGEEDDEVLVLDVDEPIDEELENEELDINEYLKAERETKKQIDEIIMVAQALREKLEQEEQSKLKALEVIRPKVNNEHREEYQSQSQSSDTPASQSLSNSLHEEPMCTPAQKNIPRLMDLKLPIPSLLDINVTPPPMDNFMMNNPMPVVNNSYNAPEPVFVDICWNCENRGHQYYNCRFPKLRQFCLNCGRPGFDNYSCPSCNNFI